jgi:DNA-binding MarR family transcriptional regulator
MTVQVMKGSIFREMMQLVQEQTEALEKQIFGGFTDEEMAKFEERQRRIRELYSREEFKRAASA